VPSYKTGTVTAILAERAGLQRIEVDGERAYVLTQLIGPVAVGDRVVVNTTAVELGLGTGGWHVVHWNLSRQAWSEPGPGHEMKLRYTSLQVDTGASASDGPGLAPGAPVIACALHSQIACVAAAFKHLRPDVRLTFVMTDSAALPLAVSDLVADLCRTGLLEATITSGQAFGGDREAVNLRAALELVDEGAAVVGPGPGVIGTATTYGFGPLEVATVIDAAVAAGGAPVVALRYSDADPRERHRGVSHHSVTALASAHEKALVPVPRGEPRPEFLNHTLVEVDVPEVPALLAAHGLTVTSMGRGPEDDPRFYAYAGAAGVAAAGLVR
jgi:hypothetical protein